MFKSLRSRILSLLVAMVLLSAVAISFLSQKGIKHAVFEAMDQHALDMLHAVQLNVESEYKGYQFYKHATLERRKRELKNIVELSLSHLSENYADYRAGRLTLREAQRSALDEIRLLRYDQGVGYLWVNNVEKPIPRMLMHPTLPQLNNEILNNPMFNTALGRNENLFAAAARLCEEHGEGYVDYLWPKPTPSGLTAQQPKVSYVKLFSPWDWVVGTGVYIDDIEAEAQRRLTAIVEELSQTFAQVRIAQNGYMFLFNGQKVMLIHPSVENGQLQSSINPDTGGNLIDELMLAAHSGQLPFEYRWDRPDDLGNYVYEKRAYISYFEPLDWYIAASMYVAEINQPVLQLQRQVVGLVLLVLLISYLLALYLSKTISQPLYRLTLVAQQIEQSGVEGVEVPVCGTRETRELGMVLQQMVDSIDEAQADLRQMNHDLESFAYTVSHDLRGLLTPIVGYAQILRDQYQDKIDAGGIESLLEIERHGDKMLVLMEDLLELAKVGHVDRPDDPVVTSTVVREVLVDLTAELEKKGVRVELKALPDVYLPDSVLSQIFSNLIGNAIRYAVTGNDVIEVGGYRRKKKVRFYVRDHGPGIGDEEKTQVFEVFYRGLSSKEKAGTGIGLATVQKIARHFGGRAWVTDTDGGGATFWIEVVDSIAPT